MNLSLNILVQMCATFINGTLSSKTPPTEKVLKEGMKEEVQEEFRLDTSIDRINIDLHQQFAQSDQK